MSLSITNNVASLTAQTNLNKTSSMLSTSLERLSSGLKINRGADGPAALVISEQQRAQIAGLQTAIANTSKAVSMVQTTEGALNEVNSLLDKIRSLALDSANTGVNDPTALAANQAEVTNALQTIDRIATNTQFGTKKLLDGTLSATPTRSDLVNTNITSQVTGGLAGTNLADGNYQLKITTAFVPATAAVSAASTSGIAVTAGTAGTFFNTAAPGTVATSASALSAQAHLFDAASGGTPAAGDTDGNAVVNASYFTESGSVAVGGRTYNYTNTTQVSTVLTAINADSANHFTVTLDDTTHQFTITGKNHLAADNGQTLAINGATLSNATTSATAGGVNDGAAVGAASVVNASHFTDTGSITVGSNVYNYTAGATVGSVLSTINSTDPNFNVTLDDASHKFTVTAKTAGATANGVQVNILGASHSGNLAATAGGADAVSQTNAAGEIVDSTGASLATPVLLTAVPLSDGTVLQNSALGIKFDVDNTAALTAGLKGDVYSVNSSGSAAVFQIGANAGQTATLSVGSASSGNLGSGIAGNQFANLSAINVTTAAGAQDSIAVIDKAIGQISTQRADLGAFQSNTLESTANNLQSTLENTTAAESVIRDTDFAAETANFTKAQVLMQVGTTVLQNANATSQLVLNLLK